MRSSIRASACLLACLFLSSCVLTSKTPLSSPETAKLDVRLLHTWKASNSDKLLRFQAVGETNLGDKAIPEGIMVMSDPNAKDRLLVFSTDVGESSYLSFLILAPKAGKEYLEGTWTWAENDIHAYMISKYDVQDGRLLMYGYNEPAVEEAIESGRIKGGAGGDPTFDDTTANLLQFFRAEGDRLFTETATSEYTQSE